MVQVAVFVGGFFGALLRVGVSHAITYAGFPLATLLINLSGTMFLPWWNGFAEEHQVPRWLQEGIGVGLCGAFTTLSSMMLDLVKLIHAGQITEAIVYFLLTSVLGLLLTYYGASLVAERQSREDN